MVPAEITGDELDREVRAELVGLSKGAAEQIARHLVAAGQVLDDDPKRAMDHAWAARARGARLAVVREACGVAAYAAAEYERALAELRAARRISGSFETIALMADCERGLGRPVRALELGQEVRADQLSRRTWVELQIVLAGARRDGGQVDAALNLLQLPELRSTADAEIAARLRYAYADALLAAGRPGDAHEWFGLAEIADIDFGTDAGARRLELEAQWATDPDRD